MTEPAALIVAVLALPLIVWPYRLARFHEQIDAIGSKRDAQRVEPAEWKVALYRYGGAAVAIGAVLLFLLG